MRNPQEPAKMNASHFKRPLGETPLMRRLDFCCSSTCISLLLSFCVLSTVAGCASGRNSYLPADDARQSEARTRDRATSGGYLYVANSQGLVSVYAIGALVPTAIISKGVSNPDALAVDTHGSLYVANGNGALGNTVTEYPQGTGSPSQTIGGLQLCCGGPSQVQELAFDLSGNLYVANGGGCPPRNVVNVYTPGSTSVSRTIGLPSSECKPFALAFDHSGNLFVITQTYAGHHGSIYEFAPGASTASLTIPDANTPVALAFDSSDNLYVGEFGSLNKGTGAGVSVFAPGQTTALRTITGLKGVLSIAIDATNTLYVADSGNSAVQVYGSKSTTPERTLFSCYPKALANDAAGNLYVADNGCNSIEVFAPKATSPFINISAGVNQPTALAMGPGTVPPAPCMKHATVITCSFKPNTSTISTSEGAPYGDVDFWTLTNSIPSEAQGTFGPTRVLRSYICLSGMVPISHCTMAHVPTGPLSPQVLAGIKRRLALFRGTGVRTMIRFTYNFGPIGAKDAPLKTILRQLAQIAPILRADKNIIFGLEAGFMGTWGEWHDSTSGNDTETARNALLRAELAAFPNLFPILVRQPGSTIAYFNGSNVVHPQVGMHDDCYASQDNASNGGDTDCETFAGGVKWYQNPLDVSSQELRSYGEAQSRESVFVAEQTGSSVSSPMQRCSSFIAYAYTLHLQAYQLYASTPLQNLWHREGCWSRIYNSIGTRIVIPKTKVTGSIKPGGIISVTIDLYNDGFGRVVRSRPIYAAILNSGLVLGRMHVPGIDLRQLVSEDHPRTLAFSFDYHLPVTLPPGSLSLGLYIADPGLPSSPAYALPLNSDDKNGNPLFDAVTGFNTIATLRP